MKLLRTRLSTALLFTLLLAVVWGCPGTREPAPVPGTDRISLISDADLTLHVSDTTAFAEAVRRSPLGALWSSEEMADFRKGETLEAHARASMDAPADDANTRRLNDLYLKELKMLSGEVVVGLDFDDQYDHPRLRLAAAMEQADFEKSLELDKIIGELEDSQSVVVKERFMDVLVIVQHEKDEDPSYQAWVGGTLLMTDDRTWLEKSIAVLKDVPARDPEGVPAFAVRLNPDLRDLLARKLKEKNEEEEEEGPGIDAEALFSSLGIDAIGEVNLSLEMKEDRADIRFTVARTGDWSRGLMALISDERAPLDFRLAYVPDDPASYEIVRLDLNALWVQLPEMVQRIAPEFAPRFEAGLEMVNSLLQIDVAQDLFANLESLYFSYSRVVGQRRETVAGFRLRDAQAMDRTLTKLFDESSVIMAQVGKLYQRNDIQGHVIHTLNLPAMGADRTPQVNRIGVGVMDGALVIGHEALLMDHAQAVAEKAGEPAFYRSSTFADMAKDLPQGVYSYSVGNLSKLAELFFAKARQAIQEQKQGPDEDLDSFERFLKGFDYERLPSDEFILGFLGRTESYALKDEKGLRSQLTVHYPDHLPGAGS